MTNAMPLLSPVVHDIHVSVVSAEEASLGVAEFWSGGRLIGFTSVAVTVGDWDRLTMDERRDLIRAVIECVEVHPGRGAERLTVHGRTG